MRVVGLLVILFFSSAACVQGASPTSEMSSSPSGTAYAQTPSLPPNAGPPIGRYQLVVVPDHSASPFLIDTVTGCVWHQVQQQETKRTTFVEVDVENLHWSWGSGAQQLLGRRIDGSNLQDDQKRTMREELQKSACGLSNVVLTPGPRPGTTPSSQ